MHYTLRNIKDL